MFLLEACGMPRITSYNVCYTKLLRECGHIVINGICHEMLKLEIARTDTETKESTQRHLVAAGFDLKSHLEVDEDIFKGVSTFSQIRSVVCGETEKPPAAILEPDTSTLEGLRQWIRKGCPTG